MIILSPLYRQRKRQKLSVTCPRGLSQGGLSAEIIPHSLTPEMKIWTPYCLKNFIAVLSACSILSFLFLLNISAIDYLLKYWFMLQLTKPLIVSLCPLFSNSFIHPPFLYSIYLTNICGPQIMYQAQFRYCGYC